MASRMHRHKPKASAETVTFPGWVVSLFNCMIDTMLSEI